MSVVYILSRMNGEGRGKREQGPKFKASLQLHLTLISTAQSPSKETKKKV